MSSYFIAGLHPKCMLPLSQKLPSHYSCMHLAAILAVSMTIFEMKQLVLLGFLCSVENWAAIRTDSCMPGFHVFCHSWDNMLNTLSKTLHSNILVNEHEELHKSFVSESLIAIMVSRICSTKGKRRSLTSRIKQTIHLICAAVSIKFANYSWNLEPTILLGI